MKCPSHIIDKLIVPRHNTVVAGGTQICRLGRFPETFAAYLHDATLFEADAQDTENIAKIATARGHLEQSWVGIPEEKGEEEVDDAR